MDGLSPNIPKSASGNVAKVGTHMTEQMAEFNRIYQFDEESGALRQRDLTVEVVYDRQYVASRYDQYPTTEAMSYLRANLVEVFCPCEDERILDFGCGNGSFLEEMASRTWGCYGMDVSGYEFEHEGFIVAAPNPSIEVDVVTFFDSLEHLPRPKLILGALNCRYVVISLPWLPTEGLNAEQFVESFIAWKHRRYGEHLWHFNPATLAKMMHDAGFDLVMFAPFEDRIRKPEGDRPNILTAIFEKRA